MNPPTPSSNHARVQLRTRTPWRDVIGMAAFAERARRELAATGETARQCTAAAHDQLTPQEAQIARLARAGLSNPEIAAQLFLSPRGRMAPAQSIRQARRRRYRAAGMNGHTESATLSWTSGGPGVQLHLAKRPPGGSPPSP
jgi:FixJ family two-component response regulator